MQPHANIDGRISLNDWFWFRNNFFHACVAKHTVGVHFKSPYKYRLSHLDSDKYDKIEKEKLMYVYMYMYMCMYMSLWGAASHSAVRVFGPLAQWGSVGPQGGQAPSCPEGRVHAAYENA